ncbi:hypothetical protein CKJ81_07070 [Corynebacterium hadale]|uniref:Uncharacterized protein n=1 Tax=Corynebacterium hadale TaxID=2026255 RepID=A0ABX4H9I2_9CORY|nr:hypothetical protein CKJ81_07070 [Corynebacterium hadale]
MCHELLRARDLREARRVSLHRDGSGNVFLADAGDVAKLVDGTRHKLSIRRVSEHRGDPRQLRDHRLDQRRILAPKRGRRGGLRNLRGHQLPMEHG